MKEEIKMEQILGDTLRKSSHLNKRKTGLKAFESQIPNDNNDAMVGTTPKRSKPESSLNKISEIYLGPELETPQKIPETI